MNRDFIKALRGGREGGHRLLNLFHKILFFLNDGFPYPHIPNSHRPVTEAYSAATGISKTVPAGQLAHCICLEVLI